MIKKVYILYNDQLFGLGMKLTLPHEKFEITILTTNCSPHIM